MIEQKRPLWHTMLTSIALVVFGLGLGYTFWGHTAKPISFVNREFGACPWRVDTPAGPVKCGKPMIPLQFSPPGKGSMTAWLYCARGHASAKPIVVTEVLPSE